MNNGMKKMNKTNKKLLTAQILLALAVCGGTALPGSCEAADITTSQTYTDTTATVTDTIDITDGTITVATSSISLLGDVSIQNQDGSTPALLVKISQISNPTAVLKVNQDGDKTVKIQGNIEERYASDGQPYFAGPSEFTCRLNNADSYLAGSLVNDGSSISGNQIILKVNNGATWYVPKTSAYECQHGYIFDLDGGYVDLYNLTPTTVRSVGGSASDTTLTLSNVGTSANGATFRVATDVANNRAYSQVKLTGATGTNTYYVQVAYDGTIKDTTSTSTGSAAVLTTDNSGDTVKGSDYTATSLASGGLLTKSVTYTPTLSSTTADGTTTWAVTSLTTGEEKTSTGPAQFMAESAQSTAKGTMGAWRAENNELMRRMGDLRGHSEQAGAWVRTYSGESEIRGNASTDLRYLGVQGGYDWDRSWQGGRLFSGIAVSHLHGSSSYAAGNGTMDSNLFGIYGSYVGDKGHYADLILKYGHVSNDFNATDNGSAFSGNNGRNGLSASFEYGRRQELTGGRFFEPQAELTYSHLNGVDYTMTMDGAAGASVHENGVNSLVGRIGGAYGIRTKDGNIYAKIGLLHEFSGDSTIETAYGTYSNRAEDSMRDTWLEYGLGFNARVADNAQVYSEFVKTAGADKLINKWMLNAGLRMSF